MHREVHDARVRLSNGENISETRHVQSSGNCSSASPFSSTLRSSTNAMPLLISIWCFPESSSFQRENAEKKLRDGEMSRPALTSSTTTLRSSWLANTTSGCLQIRNADSNTRGLHASYYTYDPAVALVNSSYSLHCSSPAITSSIYLVK